MLVLHVNGAGAVKHCQEVLPEEINEVVEPIKTTQDGYLLALVAIKEKVSEDRDHFRVKHQGTVRGILQVLQEVAQLLKRLLAKLCLFDFLSSNHRQELVQELLHVSDHVH